MYRCRPCFLNPGGLFVENRLYLFKLRLPRGVCGRFDEGRMHHV